MVGEFLHRNSEVLEGYHSLQQLLPLRRHIVCAKFAAEVDFCNEFGLNADRLELRIAESGILDLVRSSLAIFINKRKRPGEELKQQHTAAPNVPLT
jgi:hypothetical protein